MSSKFESMTGKVDYPFPEYDAPHCDPISLGGKWYQEAIIEKVNEPRAMTFATVNQLNEISTRVMAILDFDNQGIIFATHSCSLKIRDVEELPVGCGHFYWRELGRQLSVSGLVRELPRERAELEWNKRPVSLHAMSVVSHQSEPLISYEKLLNSAEAISHLGVLPCPDRFGVYVLVPKTLQFWAACSNRLHRRLSFKRTKTGWESTKLQP